MIPIVPEIDEIVDEVSALMSRMIDEFQEMKASFTDEPQKGASMIVFILAADYYASARDVLKKGRIISGGSLVRTGFENLADLFYLYDKPDKYPKTYVDSMQAFKDMMKDVATKDFQELAESRQMKQANKWTGATIEDRIKASGESLLNSYDLLSYFGHPNPASITYLSNKRLNEAQLNLLKQANCLTALTIMGVVLNHTDAKSVSMEEIDAIGKKLGTKFISDNKTAI